MGRNRARCYLAPGGKDATIAQLVRALNPFVDSLRWDIYSSTDFTKGIDMAMLICSMGLLEALISIDARGGYFSQIIMAAVVSKIVASNGDFSLHCVSNGRDHGMVCKMVAYKIRVMTAHLRVKYDDSGELEGPFEKLFVVMRANKPTSSRSGRRSQRLGNRPMPFIHFRVDEDETDESADEDEIVARYFDWDDYKAKLLKSNGEIFLADNYESSSDGFTIAEWLHDGSSLRLEIPDHQIASYQTPQLQNLPAAAAPLQQDRADPATETPAKRRKKRQRRS